MSHAVHASQSMTLLRRQVPPQMNEAKGYGEIRVPQYGETWMRHVMAGGDVRDGNILIITPRKGTAAARKKASPPHA